MNLDCHGDVVTTIIISRLVVENKKAAGAVKLDMNDKLFGKFYNLSVNNMYLSFLTCRWKISVSHQCNRLALELTCDISLSVLPNQREKSVLPNVTFLVEHASSFDL